MALIRDSGLRGFIRFDNTWNLETFFGTSGRVNYTTASNLTYLNMALDSNEKILVGTDNGVMARHTSGGVLDTIYGTQY